MRGVDITAAFLLTARQEVEKVIVWSALARTKVSFPWLAMRFSKELMRTRTSNKNLKCNSAC